MHTVQAQVAKPTGAPSAPHLGEFTKPRDEETDGPEADHDLRALGSVAHPNETATQDWFDEM